MNSFISLTLTPDSYQSSGLMHPGSGNESSGGLKVIFVWIVGADFMSLQCIQSGPYQQGWATSGGLVAEFRSKEAADEQLFARSVNDSQMQHSIYFIMYCIARRL